MRQAVIAIKYGYMTAQESKTILTGTYEKSQSLNKSVQILTSYAHPSFALQFAEFERVAFQSKLQGLSAVGRQKAWL